MGDKKEKLIIDYLNLMYSDNVKSLIYASTLSKNYFGPTGVIFVDKEPILEYTIPHNTVIETKFNFTPLNRNYYLHPEFKEKMFLMFGDVPRLLEIIIEWIFNKELKK